MQTSPVTFFRRAPQHEGALPLNQQLTELMVYLKTTETCQLNCSHCFTNGTNGRKIYFNVDKTIDWFKRMHAASPNIRSGSIAFHGGEPMLAPIEDLRKVWAACKDLWPNVWWSTTTNLVYALDDDKRAFFKEAFTHGIATSWDMGMRFSNSKQEDLWFRNVQTLMEDGHTITLMVSVNKQLIQRDPKEFLRWVESTGIHYLHLERITPNGNAIRNPDIIPSNIELDRWFMDLWHASVELNTHVKFDNLFFNSILTSYVNMAHAGCRCRSCEQKIFTVNADGTIGGCPNGAVDSTFGHIDDDIGALLTAPGRVENIVCETTRNPLCYSCDVYDVCNGDCHQLAWEGDVCASPKTLMRHFKQVNNMKLYQEVLGGFIGEE